ncbi:MAG TPA: acyloxyacyl hydrolase [Candidatus Angelobacter sp.]|nr:acyloxyacyl hydrolase [Candidatus Angelobacter sp.]
MIRHRACWYAVCFTLTCGIALAGESTPENGISDYFQSGRYDVTLSSGVMFSPIGADRNRPVENYVLNGLQVGRMLSSAHGDRWFRGNWEASVEAIGGAVFQGRGSYLAGATLWGRYNFVQPDWRVAPYLAAGAGAEATDMDQRLIGEKFNFNLNIGAGMRWFVSRQWAIDLECRYQHISNATIAKHDIGINAVGPMVGVSYFF